MNIKPNYKNYYSKKQEISSNFSNCCTHYLSYDNVSFSGLKKTLINKPKAIFLSLMALFATPNMVKAGNPLTKVVDDAASKSTLLNAVEFDFGSILEKLSNKIDAKKSYYYDSDFDGSIPNTEIINTRRLNDYKNLLENIPVSIFKKGADAIIQYKNSIISILKTCDEYGAMYIKNIPDIENIVLHSQGLDRLSAASEKIQGCKFQNAAIFNGFSVDELMRKVVIPNEKVAKGELIGENQNTMILITHEFGCDKNKAYAQDFKKKTFSFLKHYDNILVIQPNGKNADDVLNRAFLNIEKNLFKGAKTDIMYIGHEVNGFNGAKLSDWYPPSSDKGIYMLDIGDFDPLGRGGKPFSVSIANIFRNGIDNGYNPNIIGNGCKSEQLLQGAMNKILPEGYRDKVHVFGTPDFVNSSPIIDFSADNKLYFIEKVDPFFDTNKGLLIKITEAEKESQPNLQKIDSFVLDDTLKHKIITDYSNGIKKGVLMKPNGMVMEYRIITYYNFGK